MMATADACKGVPFTYLWTIENVPKLTHINLKSPRFVAHSIRKVTLYLQIVEEGAENAEKWFRCWLRVNEETLLEDDENEGNLLQEISSIVIEFTLLADDGSPIISKRSEKFYVDLMTSAVFSERYAEFIPKNKLTIQFRMWKGGYEILTRDFCYGRTKLMTYRRSFVWAVEEFSALHSSEAEDLKTLSSDEIKVYELKPFSRRWPSMYLILYLKRSSEFENVNVDFVTGEENSYAFGCELSILDANGKVIVSKAERGCMGKKLKFCSLILRSELMAKKNLLLPNNALLLSCCFEVPFGKITSRLEYCTPNVSSGIEPIFEFDTLNRNLNLRLAAENNPLEFQEYLINQVYEKESLNIAAKNDPLEFEDDPIFDYFDEYDPFDGYDSLNCSERSKNIEHSCRDSCKLRAVLKKFQNDTTLSDFSLKIGAKYYPVHRNMLCSRSPVFKKILNDDVLHKTIEIEDMDENTLCHLLHYIYTDEVEDLNLAIALDLYKAAHHYQLLDLRSKCCDFLENNLWKANLCEILSLANNYQDEELEKRVRESIPFRIEQLRQSDTIPISIDTMINMIHEKQSA